MFKDGKSTGHLAQLGFNPAKEVKPVINPASLSAFLSFVQEAFISICPIQVQILWKTDLLFIVYISPNCVFQLEFSTKTSMRWQKKITLHSLLGFQIILFTHFDTFQTNGPSGEQNQYEKLSQLVLLGYWQNHCKDKRHFTRTTHIITESFRCVIYCCYKPQP